MSPAKSKSKQIETVKTNPPDIESLSYELALAELEKIVASLEASRPEDAGAQGQPGLPGNAGQLSLDEAMALFERGQALSRHCVDLLEKAELRVKQLTGDTLEDLPPDV